MRKRLTILIATLVVAIPNTASASLDATEDFSEPRIMAISVSSSIGDTPWANGSGYLYSPRIVFSAGHIKDHDEFSQMYVSQPNQKLKAGMETVKVIKKIFPSTYKTRIYKDDFAILILEKPLADVAPAPLITSELLAQAIAEKIPMKQLGFGAYQDVCAELKVSSPCQFGSDRTSLVPRSIEMVPWDAAGVKARYNQYQAEIADHLFLTSPYRGGPCPGDSGGSTTVKINGVTYYVATVASGFWNGYSCGQGGGTVEDSLGYTAPVFKFLELIAEAEKYVAEHPYIAPIATASKSPVATPSPSAPQIAIPSASPKATKSAAPSSSPKATKSADLYQYIFTLAKQWAKTSKPGDTALKQCTSARDKGLIYKNGKATPIVTGNTNLRRDLNRYPGFNACLSGFSK
jgi:Trypsin